MLWHRELAVCIVVQELLSKRWRNAPRCMNSEEFEAGGLMSQKLLHHVSREQNCVRLTARRDDSQHTVVCGSCTYQMDASF